MTSHSSEMTPDARDYLSTDSDTTRLHPSDNGHFTDISNQKNTRFQLVLAVTAVPVCTIAHRYKGEADRS